MENGSSHPSAPPNTSATSGTTASTGPAQNSLRMLNKNSHKISKHISKQHLPIASTNPNPPSTPPLETTPNPTPAPPPPPPQPQPQPPVYNINKNDFRDVVQKLTGSPAHLNVPRTSDPPVSSRSPPPPNRPAATSRLHKIRPPPLSQLGPRPGTTGSAGGNGGNVWMRPSMTTPNSPLPALPTVSAAAESPITAYMRCLHSGGFGGLQQQQGLVIPTSPGSMGVPLFPLPTSPLGFGCILSPSSGPPLPLPSPKWKEQ